jgi:hypothetical protein
MKLWLVDVCRPISEARRPLWGSWSSLKTLSIKPRIRLRSENILFVKFQKFLGEVFGLKAVIGNLQRTGALSRIAAVSAWIGQCLLLQLMAVNKTAPE